MLVEGESVSTTLSEAWVSKTQNAHSLSLMGQGQGQGQEEKNKNKRQTRQIRQTTGLSNPFEEPANLGLSAILEYTARIGHLAARFRAKRCDWPINSQLLQ